MGITPMITNEVGILADEVTYRSPVQKPAAAILRADLCKARTWFPHGPGFPHTVTKSAVHLPDINKLIRVESQLGYRGDSVINAPEMIQESSNSLKQKSSKVKEMKTVMSETGNQGLQEQRSLFGNHVCKTGDTIIETFSNSKKSEDRSALNKTPAIDTNKREQQVSCELSLPTLLESTTSSRTKKPRGDKSKIRNKNGVKSSSASPSQTKEKQKQMTTKQYVTVDPKPTDQSDALVAFPNDMQQSVRRWPPDKCSRYMQYVINGHHTFEVTVSADVVQKTLLLTPSCLEFSSGQQDTMFQPKFMVVGIINHLPAYTQFKWEVPDNSIFSVKPETGLVPPLTSLQCCVRVTPDANKPSVSDLMLVSENGEARQVLKCSHKLGKPSAVYFLNSRLVINHISLNLLSQYTLLMHNEHTVDFMFKVMNPNPMPGCTVSPKSGIIRGRSLCIFQLDCKIPAVVDFEFVIRVQIQKSKIVELKVVGSVDFPTVVLKPDILRLRRISADSFDTIQLRAENEGLAVAKLTFPLENFPEYQISESPDIYDLSKISEQGYMIQPGKKKLLYLHFIPSDVATYVFALPLVINDILGPADLEDTSTHYTEHYLPVTESWFSKTIQPKTIPTRIPVVSIDCTVANHILSFSKKKFNFRYVPSESKANVRTEDSVRITNALGRDVRFTVDTEQLLSPGCPFLIHTESGTHVIVGMERLEVMLRPHHSVIIHVIFSPNMPGHYVTKLPVYVEGYESLFSNIYLEGVYPPPTLSTNVKEIFFPPLPLGIASVTQITLTASYYKKTAKAKALIVPVEINGCCVTDTLSVRFVAGNVIKAHRSAVNLVVKIVFKSDRPTSFKTVIRFLDSQGSKCSVYITASADNCVLSTYAFLGTTSAIRQVTSSDSSEEDEGISVISEEKCTDIISLDSSQTQLTPYLQQMNIRRRMSNIVTPNTIEYSSISLFTESLTAIMDDYGSYISQSKFGSEEEEVKSDQTDVVFPCFPERSDSSESAKFMTAALHAVEHWLYEQAFRCIYAPSLPTGITIMLSEAIPSDGKMQTKFGFNVKTILDVIENISGISFHQAFNMIATQSERVHRVERRHVLLKELIVFLEKQGCCLSHVCPKYLLDYSDYVVYMTNVRPFKIKESVRYATTHRKSENSLKTASYVAVWEADSLHSIKDFATHMNEQEFNRRTTQSWLDLLLQLHKTFVLSRISFGPSALTDQESESTTSQEESPGISVVQANPTPMLSSIDSQLNRSVYGNAECVLLTWLQTACKKQAFPWALSKDQCNIHNFDCDLADGLVFASVTAMYCPYLVPLFFNNLIPSPKTEEQAFHNAVQVTNAWQTINLGFTVGPEDIVNPNVVKMVILTAYLYESLPSFTPRCTIKFDAELNSEEFRKITLSNPSDKRVTYGIKFLGDSQGFFRVAKSMSLVTIARNSHTVLSLGYNARHVGKKTATLILCGSVLPRSYARNLTFELEGCSSRIKLTETFTFTPNLYTLSNETLSITPPYPESTDYDIYMTETEPSYSNEGEWTRWKDVCQERQQLRIHIYSGVFHVFGDDPIYFPITLACITPVRTRFWFIFKSEEIGDFIIMIDVIPDKITIMCNIKVMLPQNWTECECNCEKLEPGSFYLTDGCPLRTIIRVPCRNFLFWNVILMRMGRTLRPKEMSFWQTYLETDIGIRLFRNRLQNNPISLLNYELVKALDKVVTYNVTSTNPKMILLPSQITISDVHDSGTVVLPVHVSPEIDADTSITLILTSKNDVEIRSYNLRFISTDVQSSLDEQIN